ncbi:sodium:glutamate symporter [Oscillibacter hominis]|uniref:Sodium:glutamate symporter n=1 Tax=Oscillibacter hominis TaxID=2763056 RepID=A0A7G9B1M5_9FIRM|nr:sodium:glutamate symporter [Oscillibacter hominis]QNL43456.1 sodium:glutamate symporter [Oscillibacter hominis]
MTDIFLDFAIASALILAGQLIRSKVKAVQAFFVPASLIAGIIGLIMGSYGFDVLKFSESAGSYAGILIVIVFTAVGVQGFHFATGAKKEIGRMMSFLSYRFFGHCIQVAIPVLISVLLIARLVPGTSDAFGFILISGFCGGHGTAAAVGVALGDLGFADAMDLCMTSATVGILTGVFGGMILIKIATKKGYTEFIKDFRFISGELRTGLIPKEKQQSMCRDGVSVVSIDPLAWHTALLLVPAGLGILGARWVSSTFSLSIPDYCVGFLFGLVFWAALKKAGVYEYVDTELFGRISGCATDYLVFFGVALIKIPVVVKYALPLLILMLTGIVLVVVNYTFFGSRMNEKCWCERSIFCYGYLTGVFAIGFVLLRIVDPQNKSRTLSDTAITTPFTTLLEIFTWSFCPAMLMAGRVWLVVGLFGAIAAACLIASRSCGWWYGKLPKAGRGAYGE